MFKETMWREKLNRPTVLLLVGPEVFPRTYTRQLHYPPVISRGNGKSPIRNINGEEIHGFFLPLEYQYLITPQIGFDNHIEKPQLPELST